MKMKDLPSLERPYEKLETYGATGLSMAELLAIIIKSGTKNKTAVEISQELLSEEKEEDGIWFLKHLSLQELMKKEGIGRVKAIQLKAMVEIVARSSKPSKIMKTVISSPEEVYKIVASDFKCEQKEVIKTLILDKKNRLMKMVENAIGTHNASYVEVKEIFKEPVKIGGTTIILVHNHPSGDATPSEDDYVFTQRMKEAGKIVGIHLQDHVIIGDGEFSSLKRMNKI